MKKSILFDMDGTIADLYNTENWLPKLQAEEKGLFRNLKEMYCLKELKKVCLELLENGWELGVITWLPMNVSKNYENQVAKEKVEWIAEFMPYISEIHCLEYGTPKQKANHKKYRTQILVDDNAEVREMWETPKQRKSIDPTENLLEKLQQLLS